MTGSARRPGPRARVAILVVLAYAAVSSARWIGEIASRGAPAGRDEISANDRRFAPVRGALSAAGRIGYVGDPPPDSRLPNGSSAALLHFRRYLLAEYALAPVILIDHDTTSDLVLGNFDPGDARAAPAGFRVVRDFGDGLVLYRRVAP